MPVEPMKWWYPVVILLAMSVFALGSWLVLVAAIVTTLRWMGVLAG